MFNLILTLAGLALTLGLVLVAMIYSGSAFVDGGAKTGSAQLISGMNQIQSALLLYQSDHGSALWDLGLDETPAVHEIMLRDPDFSTYLGSVPSPPKSVIDPNSEKKISETEEIRTQAFLRSYRVDLSFSDSRPMPVVGLSFIRDTSCLDLNKRGGLEERHYSRTEIDSLDANGQLPPFFCLTEEVVFQSNSFVVNTAVYGGNYSSQESRL